MSRENVELAYRLYDAVNRRDLDALLALTDEEVELVSVLVAVDGDYHGHEGFRRWWENVFQAFPDYMAEAGEIRDLGDVTLASLRIRGHGLGSGAPIDQPLFQLVQWRRAKALHLESFRSEAEALQSLVR